MRLRDLLADVDVRELRGDDSVVVTSVTHDSRVVQPGALFCCVSGAAFDGHDYAEAAVAAGAVAVVVERMVDVAAPQVRVDRVRDVLGPIATAVCGHPSESLRLLGVTGTNGKTTTAYLLEAIGATQGEPTGLIGTVETRIAGELVNQPRTTPEAPELQALLARMVESGVRTVAMEVSSHALDMGRVRGTRFAAACFTNIGHDHLDYHGTHEQYLEAKAALFTPEYTAAVAVNVDDAEGPGLVAQARRSGLDVIAFGRGDDADITAVDVSLSRRATRLTLLDRRLDRRATVATPLVGEFNVMNVLAAAATALAAGLEWPAVHEGLSAPVTVPGRMELVSRDDDVVVIVDYAHTPDALDRVLTAARELTLPGGELVVVFGAGGDRDESKRPLMGAAASARADRVVVTSDNPRSEDPESIISAIVAGIPSRSRATVLAEPDRRRAIRAALAAASEGDVVVIAGKGHESGQTFGSQTRPFDDRTVAREELGARACG